MKISVHEGVGVMKLIKFTKLGQSGVAIVLTCAIWTDGAWSHSVDQVLGIYADNQGLERHRIGYDIGVDSGRMMETMSASSLNLVVTQDQIQTDEVIGNAYQRSIYGSSYRLNRSVAVAATQTWEKITDTNIMASYSTDDHVNVRTWGAGVAQWLYHDTLRLSVDVSRTLVDQPVYEMLDYDSQTVASPPVMSSAGGFLGIRHLATRTTVLDYGFGEIAGGNRPVTKTLSFGIRQFIVPTDSALHFTAIRTVNRGVVSLASSYGQVDAWIGELAWLQRLWQKGSGKLSYRYYREDETTRAYGDERQFGSDTISISLVQDIAKRAIDNLAVPISVRLAYARYLTNTNIAANAYEAGIGAKF